MRVNIGVNRVLINNSQIWKLGAKAILVEDFPVIAQTVLAKFRVARFNVEPAIISAKEGKLFKLVGDPFEGFKDLQSINCAYELQAIGDGQCNPHIFPSLLFQY
jgi:hypothetical protein